MVGQDMNLSFSQPSVSRAIHKVSEAITETLMQEFVRFPSLAEDRENAKHKFRNAAQPFVGAIGAIDCTHISIKAPTEHEDQHVNHKGFHSLNVQAICDPSFRIIQVCARFPGARHDAFIWGASPGREQMKQMYEAGERQTWLIGDSGYPLEPWLLTPIPDAPPGTPDFRYTNAHCKARSVIERTFGILKGVLNCLSRRRVLLYEPLAACRIVNACVVLHNLRLHYNLDIEDDEIEAEEEDDVGAREPAPEGRHHLAEARRIRDAYIRRHFA